MRLRLALICSMMILWPLFCAAEGLLLLSVNPAVGYPGQSVQLRADGFSPATRVVLGAEEITSTCSMPDNCNCSSLNWPKANTHCGG